MSDRTAADAGDVWDLWHDGAHSPAGNMAADEALLETLTNRSCPLLRIYEWDRPAVSLGYFQPQGLGDETGMDWVRRPTGGGLVRHDCDLTFTIVAPKSHPLMQVDRFESYRQINDAVARGLAMAGLPAVHLHPDDIPKSVDRAELVCFTTPAQHDVIGARGKVAGGAQRRTATGLLHQGSIDLRLYPEVDRPRLAATALADGFAATFGCRFNTFTPPADFAAGMARFVIDKYATDSWNRKR